MCWCCMTGEGPSHSPQLGFAESNRNFSKCPHIWAEQVAEFNSHSIWPGPDPLLLIWKFTCLGTHFKYQTTLKCFFANQKLQQYWFQIEQVPALQYVQFLFEIRPLRTWDVLKSGSIACSVGAEAFMGALLPRLRRESNGQGPIMPFELEVMQHLCLKKLHIFVDAPFTIYCTDELWSVVIVKLLALSTFEFLQLIYSFLRIHSFECRLLPSFFGDKNNAFSGDFQFEVLMSIFALLVKTRW